MTMPASALQEYRSLFLDQKFPDALYKHAKIGREYDHFRCHNPR
jgi:hypothetical protein